MYNYFWEKNKIFFAIIAGALIIGGFVYFGLSKNKQVVIPAKAGIQIAASPEAPRNDEKVSEENAPVENPKPVVVNLWCEDSILFGNREHIYFCLCSNNTK